MVFGVACVMSSVSQCNLRPRLTKQSPIRYDFARCDALQDR